MLTTLSVGSAVEAAHVLTAQLPKTLSETAQKLCCALVAAAIETAKGRGYSPNTTHITMHVPLEIVAKACGVSRVTAWRHLPQLRDLGLIDYRTHKGTCRGETRNTGTLWQIRLTPTHGSKAHLSYADLKHRWRDLDRDVRAGRTSYTALKHTQTLEVDLVDIKSILAWTLPPKTHQSPVAHVCFSNRRVELESVLDVRHAPREERGPMIELAAQALTEALGDRAGENFYRRLLWQLLRRFDATGEDHSYSVYLVAQRARTDAQEGFARRPGALFVSRLKAAPWWSEVMRAPPRRVGVRPTQA
jgi:hypothetical protein